MLSLKKQAEALSLLKQYTGNNPYIKNLYRAYYEKSNADAVGSFQMEYILTNYSFEPKLIDQVVKITEDYAKSKMEQWGIDFIPQKIKIGYLLGETPTTYHCYIKYKQNQEKAVQAFLPKKALLDDFLIQDYNLLDIDFDKYDNIASKKDQNRKLKEHQKSGVKFLLTRKKAILGDDCGLGKSAELVTAALEGGFKKVLIICPASIKTTWKRELMWYTDESNISIISSFLTKTKPELEEFLGYEVGKSGLKVDELKKLAKEKGKWDDSKQFTIINYDILNEFYKIPKSRKKEDIEEALNNSPMLHSGFDLLIIDEAHKLSNNTSIRYKIINDFKKRSGIENIWPVTGTLVTNRPYNLYNILKLVDAEVTKDWEYYVKRYCDGFQIPAAGEKQRWTQEFINRKRKNTYYDLTDQEREELKEYIKNNAKMIWITKGASNLDELSEKIKHSYIRRLKTDIKGVVDKEIIERYYSLTRKERLEYKELWNQYENDLIESGKDISRANRGLIEGTLFKQFVAKTMMKNTIDLAENYIEDDEKVLIICSYDEEVYGFKEHFGEKAVIYNGKMSEKQKNKSEDDFMKNDSVKVFIGQIMASGVGLSLPVSRIAIFNSFSFVPADNLQVMDRIHRITQTRDISIYFQLFEDTYHDVMWNSVVKKQMIINSIVKTETEK